MEATQDTAQVTPELTAEEKAKKGIEQTLAVVRVVENLFNALKRASYPLETTEAVTTGLGFLAQFHSQLVGQLPPAMVEELRKAAQPAAEVTNVPKA